MDERFKIWTKGTAEDAQREATKRGLTYEHERIVESCNWSIGTVTGDRSALAAWFADDPFNPPGGYRPGALLLFA